MSIESLGVFCFWKSARWVRLNNSQSAYGFNLCVIRMLRGSWAVLELFRLDPVRALHQAYIVVHEFVEPLGPVKPIITAFQFRPE